MSKLFKWIKGAIGTVIIVSAVLYFVGKANDAQWEKKRSSINQDTYMSLSVAGEHDAVARHPDQQKGKMMYVTGTVGQVMENGNKVTLLIFDHANSLWYVTYRYADGEGRILENDRITMYGECTGTTTYKTVNGAQNTVPSLEGYFYR